MEVAYLVCSVFLFVYQSTVVELVMIPQMKIGSACRLENKKIGVCRRIENCSWAVHRIEELDEWPLICFTPRYDSIVCCDEANPTAKIKTTSTPKPTSPPVVKTGLISKQKCEEYSKWEEPVTLLFTTTSSKRQGLCRVGMTTFIVGGERADKMEFPHMVRLGYGEMGYISWDCGGSLISEKFVLTAAHCLRGTTAVTHVMMGTDDARSLTIAKVVRTFAHPRYKKPQHYNDIALLEINKEVQFNNFLRPACLQVDRDITSETGIASGWGLTTSTSKRISPHLRRVELPLVKQSECSQIYEEGNDMRLVNGLDDDTMICAGALDLGKDTCQGDSGGPLQVILKHPSCMYSIIGITSFGKGCGIAPGVYTRVSHYVPWIESIVWPQKDDT